jgi:hypothetical protein
MNNTRTLTIAAVFMAATLVVIGVATFAVTTTRAETESESSSTTCINDQPCQSTVSNSNTTDSTNVNHNRIQSTICVNDQPCQTTDNKD